MDLAGVTQEAHTSEVVTTDKCFGDTSGWVFFGAISSLLISMMNIRQDHIGEMKGFKSVGLLRCFRDTLTVE